MNLQGCSGEWVKCCYCSLHKGKQNSRLQTLPKVNFWTSTWIFWCVFSRPAFRELDHFLACHKNFVCKCCSVKIHLLDRNCFGVSLNEWCQVCGYCWLFRIFSNFFFFFLTTLVYVGREVWTLQGDTDGQSGEGFLLSLHSFLPSTPPLHAKLLKM